MWYTALGHTEASFGTGEGNIRSHILGGLQMGCQTVLTLSGGTREDDVERFAYRPDRIIRDVSELCSVHISEAEAVPA